MPDNIYIGNFAKGLKTNPLPFNIDNDSFPTLYNFYVWRGRAKRKRGTGTLARLQRQIQSVTSPTLPWQFNPLALSGGVYNIIGGAWTRGPDAIPSPLEANGQIVPGSVDVVVGGINYTEPSQPDGTLLKAGVPDPTSSINYALGIITIGGAVGSLTGTFSYFPDLPVLGLEDFVPNDANSQFPLLIAFDPTYAYQINQNGALFFYGINYYKNSNVPFIWSNDDSNQFWSTNYQSAFWVTNNKPGLHFVNGTYVSGSGTENITFNFMSGGVNFTDLVIGDVLWFNEWDIPTAKIEDIPNSPPGGPTVITAPNTFVPGQSVKFSGIMGMTQLNTGTYVISAATATTFTIPVDSSKFGRYETKSGTATIIELNTINGVSGIVTDITGSAAGNYVVTFDNPQTVSGIGIAQLLTNSIEGQDGIKWYDGDPTSGTGLPTGTPQTAFGTIGTSNLGWVNFAPPLTALSVSINSQVEDKYYLVGALAMLPFKDRLLFFGPQIQAINNQSTPGPVIQKPLQDTVLWSWNGTPYYSQLVPTNTTFSETYDNSAYYVDQTGKGGYLPAGISQPLTTIASNEDVLLIGFGGAGKKTRFVYTGNDLQPFVFYLINSQLPSSSTFSTINLDQGAIDIGSYGITVTTQQQVERIDLDIPDSVFKIQALNDGQKRVNAIRDFFREWLYFSFPIGDGKEDNGSWKYPARTLMYNYRDSTWAVFRENFTHHGSFRRSSHLTWDTLPFKTWDAWNEPWNSGSSTALFPSIIGGNPQGYVLIKSQQTGEAPSGYIQAISDDGFGFTQITSHNHCVNDESNEPGIEGDYLSFGGPTIGLVTKTPDADTFVVDIPYNGASVTVTIVAATNATSAVLTLDFNPVAVPPSINSFFVGQRVDISGVGGMTQLNGNTYTVMAVTPGDTVTKATITLNVDSTAFGVYTSGGSVVLNAESYIGLAEYTRLIQPLLQTKQFPLYWQEGRGIRLGVQKYLMEKTSTGQVTVNINLSQDPADTWNENPVLPSNNVTNSALVYSQTLYTCPESSNIGLTPANTNLQMPISTEAQIEIWHRINTSLQGDTFQVGITLSDAQMRNISYATDEIVLHGMQFTVNRGPLLS